MKDKFKKGLNVSLDRESQIEFNRRKNIEQDNKLEGINQTLEVLVGQHPSGFLPMVYSSFSSVDVLRFNVSAEMFFSTSDPMDIIVVDQWEKGDILEIRNDSIGPAESVNALARFHEVGKITVPGEGPSRIIHIIRFNKGDYPANTTGNFYLLNTRTGQRLFDTTGINVINSTSLQPSSRLIDFEPNDYKNKMITVLNPTSANRNELYSSVDFDGDGDYHWVKVGSFTNGKNGYTPYIGSNGNWFINGVDQLKPSRGEKGDTGEKGNPGVDGIDGKTPYIVDNYWYINDTNLNVKALGTDGNDGQDGKTFEIKSGLYSAPENIGNINNLGPEGDALSELPTLPTTGVSGYGYVVYDRVTTPLSPFYDLYWAKDGDANWTIMHPFSGLKGKNGTDGHTPYIGSDNYWYIDGVSTGVRADGHGLTQQQVMALIDDAINDALEGDY